MSHLMRSVTASAVGTFQNNLYGGHVQRFTSYQQWTNGFNVNTNWNNFARGYPNYNYNYNQNNRDFQPPWDNYNNRNYRQPISYNSYNRSNFRSPKKFNCNFCHELFFNFSQKKAHENKEHAPLGCAFCSRTFRVKHDLYLHKLQCSERPKEIEAVPPKPQDCNNSPPSGSKLDSAPSDAKIENKSALNKETGPEVNSAEKENLGCSYCVKTFPSEAALKKHIKSVHTVGSLTHGTLRCPFCARTLQTRRSLYFHMKVHTKVFFCNVCPAEFKSKKKLNRHVYNEHVSTEK